MPNKDDINTAPTVFGMCKVCGSLYALGTKNDPGFCGRASCQETLNNSRVVSTPVYGTNVNIITYNDGYGAITETNANLDTGVNNVNITRNIDTTEKDLENAKKIEEDFNNRFGKKVTKKAKSRRVSKTSK